jgi:hypothetical protein
MGEKVAITMQIANLISAFLFGPKHETSLEYRSAPGEIEERWFGICGTDLIESKSQGRFRLQQRDGEVWVRQFLNRPSMFVAWSKVGFHRRNPKTSSVWIVTKVRWSGWLGVLLPLLVSVMIVFAYFFSRAIGNRPIDWVDLAKIALVVVFCAVFFCFGYLKARILVKQRAAALMDLAQEHLEMRRPPDRREKNIVDEAVMNPASANAGPAKEDNQGKQ